MQSFEVGPLSPVLMDYNDNIKVIEDALNSAGFDKTKDDKKVIIPALFLQYALDKNKAELIKKSSLLALNAVTIATGVPEIIFAANTATRIFAAAQVAGAMGDITVNTDYIEKNYPNIKANVDIYNGLMGLVGLKNLANSTGFKNLYTNLPQKVKQAYQENKSIKPLIAAEYLKWQVAFKNLKNITAAENQLLTKQEKIWKAFGVLDKIESLIFKGLKYEDFILTFTATEEQYKKAYQLWGEGKWNELFDYFKAENLNNWNGIIWPPSSGFARINKTISAKNYEFRIDRFQKESSLGGGFGSPILKNSEGIDDLVYTYDSRMLSDKISEGTYYFVFQMSHKAADVELKIGDVAPWFKKEMSLAGEQIEFSKKLHVMDATYFKKIEAKVFFNGKWRKCVVEGKGVITELQIVFNKLPIDVSDDLIDYINSSSKVLSDFKEAQRIGKLDEMVKSYQIFRKNNIKKPCL